jgi:glycosyltransferase involved in cell wall biosynthesis
MLSREHALRKMQALVIEDYDFYKTIIGVIMNSYKGERDFSLSISVPMYNEEENIDAFFMAVLAVLEKLTGDYEIVCVNDGSTDNTLKKLLEHHERNPRIKVINFSRNFGKDIALTAAIDFTTGDAVVPIDADLQDPPEVIEELVEKWKEGFDVVYATRAFREGEGWLKKLSANMFYKVINKLSHTSIPNNTGDFRLIDKRVVNALKSLNERTRFMKGLFSWVGFKQTSVMYTRQPRFSGKTKWSYWKLWNFAIDGITSFSSFPLKTWSYVGAGISMCAFFYAAYLFYTTLVYGVVVPGYASIMVTTLFIGGVILISLGVIGEYLGRIYDEVKRRPLYLVSELWGVDKDEDPSSK